MSSFPFYHLILSPSIIINQAYGLLVIISLFYLQELETDEVLKQLKYIKKVISKTSKIVQVLY